MRVVLQSVDSSRVVLNSQSAEQVEHLRLQLCGSADGFVEVLPNDNGSALVMKRHVIRVDVFDR